MSSAPSARTSERLPCGRPAPRSGGASKADLREPRLEKFARRLDAHVLAEGLKRSDIRHRILEVIVRDARHFRVADFLPLLQKRYPEIGRATVYRALPVLVASGVLQEGPRDSAGQIFYELADGHHHDHIVCLDCHEIFEFHDDQIESRQKRITDKMGFAPADHRHVIYVHCRKLPPSKRAP